ncbi:MAG: pyridine nucleotide-disulfide oxidoreductase [Myxococcaceae bacterium]|nr:pyridine nucleotide-disulfide oxidoreductase [Myxococcaceae bacterium]
MTNKIHEVLVLGGGYAGVLCANRLAGRLGASARVTLATATPDFVHRVRLHELLAGRPFPRRSVRELLADGVALRIGRVEAASLAARTATVDGAALPFDAMVCALGSAPTCNVPGVAEHAAGLANPAAAARVAGRLRTLPERSPVAVIGGGFTGVEVAAEIAEAWPALRVSLLTSALAPGLSDAGRRYLRASLDALGVEVVENASVRAVAADAVEFTDGSSLPAALTVWAGGFAGSAPAVDADWPLDGRGRIVVDADLGVRDAPGVFAAGDVAASAPGMESSLRMGCVTAMPLGAHAADNVVRHLRGEATRPFAFGFRVQCVSLGRRRGLVQPVDARDQTKPWVVTGRLGALVKESICRYVVGALRVEAAAPGMYRWPGGVVAAHRALPAAADA